MGRISEHRAAHYSKKKRKFVTKLVEQGLNVTAATQKMCEHFKLKYDESVGRNFRAYIQKNFKQSNPVEESEAFKKAQAREFDTTKQRFIFSWAQVETAIHEQFLTNIEAYASHIDASIHIIAGKYKNPNSLEASKEQDKKDRNKNNWHPRIVPYLDANRQNIHPHLSVLADVKVQPTASLPLTGLNGLTALESSILGHPQVHMKSLPVLDGYPNKQLLTTGAVTVPNYTNTKIGAKSAFHHQLGFVIVELDGEIFHVRQVQCTEDGSFYDLSFYVNNGVVSYSNESYPAIVWGDVHYGHHNQRSLDVSLELARKFRVDCVVLHDIFDAKSISHHELNNPFLQLENEVKGTGDLLAEIDRIVDFLNENKDLNFVAVRSNHDDFLDRWLLNTDWRKQPNRAAYLHFASIVSSGQAPKGVIPYVLENRCKNVKALGINDSFRILDWELAIHGHLGNNGSRGSAIQYKNLNTKNITAHTHTPTRVDGHLSVGTLTYMRVGYNNGSSSWMTSNVIMYPNGKVSHINIVKGKYTTLK